MDFLLLLGWNNKIRKTMITFISNFLNESIHWILFLPVAFFFFFLVVTFAAYGSFLARDWIWATALTYATGLATPYPSTHQVRTHASTVSVPPSAAVGFLTRHATAGTPPLVEFCMLLSFTLKLEYIYFFFLQKLATGYFL